MSISYPLTVPSHKFRSIKWKARSVVGMHQSPFTMQAQTYLWPARWWEVSVALPPMKEATADDWIAFLMSLNGAHGYFKMGDSVRRTPLSGAVSATVSAAASAGASTIRMNVSSGSFTIGDWFSLSSDRYLFKILKLTLVSGTTYDVDVFPNLRVALSGGEAVNTSNPMGYFRLSSVPEWSVDVARFYGLEFTAVEYIPTT